MVKRIILALALLVGALALAPGSSQATPLGASAQAAADVSTGIEKAQYYYRRHWRRRHYWNRPYYRRRHYYRRHYWRPRPYYRRRYWY